MLTLTELDDPMPDTMSSIRALERCDAVYSITIILATRRAGYTFSSTATGIVRSTNVW